MYAGKGLHREWQRSARTRELAQKRRNPNAPREKTLAGSPPLAYFARWMEFYETDIFTEQIVATLDDDSYRKLQSVLIQNPEAGDLIPRTRGLRKIRWQAPGRG